MKSHPAQLEAQDGHERGMTAMYVAMVVRNALEEFHCKHLSDEQMKELNPLIRNAIGSALYAYAHFEDSPAARRFVQYHLDSIPAYWERPRIHEALKRDTLKQDTLERDTLKGNPTVKNSVLENSVLLASDQLSSKGQLMKRQSLKTQSVRGAKTTSSSSPPVYQLKITLKGVRPLIWRRVQVPSTITLKKLHRVIQTAMGWSDSHLHQFIIDGQHYSLPEFELDIHDDLTIRDETRVRLDSVLSGVGSKFAYEYDFGDNWQHEIVVEQVLDEQALDEEVPDERKLSPSPQMRSVRCITGKRACPPEDCGGVRGYETLLETVADPRHEDHLSLKEWLGGDFDAEAFDLDAVNRKLATLR